MCYIEINNRQIGLGQPVYFIADIAANHCGSLTIAKELIHACAESRVDAVKMQNFAAETIVSDYGFKKLSALKTHQSEWKVSVFDSYKSASIPLDWTSELKALCDKLGLHYLTSPYSLELVRELSPHVCAFKLGSGDITWHEEIEAMCESNKPVIIATGASTMDEVEDAMAAAVRISSQIVLMQCNTEYTASLGETLEQKRARFRHINLRVIETYRRRWSDVPVGLSDHTHGDLTVMGAVGLFGCSVVEKHFTFDNSLVGQDHAFSMTPEAWKLMVDRVESLQAEINRADGMDFDQRLRITRSMVDDPESLILAIGDGIKRLEANESATVIVQRRALRASSDLVADEMIKNEDIVPLRPCPPGALPPHRVSELIGKGLKRNIAKGDCVYLNDCR
jgi:sialic acid synthase SpsE